MVWETYLTLTTCFPSLVCHKITLLFGMRNEIRVGVDREVVERIAVAGLSTTSYSFIDSFSLLGDPVAIAL